MDLVRLECSSHVLGLNGPIRYSCILHGKLSIVSRHIFPSLSLPTHRKLEKYGWLARLGMYTISNVIIMRFGIIGYLPLCSNLVVLNLGLGTSLAGQLYFIIFV